MVVPDVFRSTQAGRNDSDPAYLQVTSEKAVEGLFFAVKDLKFGTDMKDGKAPGSTNLARSRNGETSIDAQTDTFPTGKK